MTGLLIPNSTQVPNFLLDDILPLATPAEWKVITFICRKTFGWQKREDRISLTQFERGTGLSRRALVTILGKLTASTLLLRTAGSMGDTYALYLDCDAQVVAGALSSLVHSVHQCTQFTKTGEPTSPELVNSVHPQKPTINKTKKPTKTRLPENFSISDRVRRWATESGHTQLEERFEHFVGYAKANGKTYADWDQAFMNAIRGDWAHLNQKGKYRDVNERNDATIDAAARRLAGKLAEID